MTLDQYSYSNKPILNGKGLLDENGSIQLFGNVQYDGAGMIEDFGFAVSSGISLDRQINCFWVRGMGEPMTFLSDGEIDFEVLYFRAGHEMRLDMESVLSKLKIPEAPQIW